MSSKTDDYKLSHTNRPGCLLHRLGGGALHAKLYNAMGRTTRARGMNYRMLRAYTTTKFEITTLLVCSIAIQV